MKGQKVSSSAKSPWAGKRRTRESEFPKKKEAVLQAAAALFRTRGYEGSSLNELADILNVSKPTIYYYVSSKDHLLLEIKRIVQEEVIGHLRSIEASNKTGYEKLRDIIVEYAKVMTSDYGACLALIPPHAMEPASRAEVEGRIHEADSIINRVIAEGEADDSLIVQDPVIVRQAIFGSLNWMSNWYKPGGRLSPENLAELLADTLLDGVRGDRDPPPARKSAAVEKKDAAAGSVGRKKTRDASGAARPSMKRPKSSRSKRV